MIPTVLNPIGQIRFVSRSRELRFASPMDIVVASTIGEVIPCLQRVASGVARGLYAAGFIAYEAASAFDPALKTHDPGVLPLLWFGLYRTVTPHRLENISEAPRPEDGAPRSAVAALAAQGESFAELAVALPSSAPLSHSFGGSPRHSSPRPRDSLAKASGSGTFNVGTWTPMVLAEDYRSNIQRIRDWIVAGDTYQVNYTFPLRAAFHGDTQSWFRQLCVAQQADYCAYVSLGRMRLLSASPELFFRLKENTLEARPMKGTRPRGRWSEEDQRLAKSLAASEKDRAENVMIVDLLRNDMTRISEPGSVRVRSLYDVESYPTVWQMTSTIHSRTTASVPDIIRALFPSGSVTGAPKIRTMEIIRDLEPYPRGIYCGTIGWWAPDGHAEFNVAIRTVTVDTEAGQAFYHVGSGITYGSSPEDEYEECLDKATLLTRRDPEFELMESLRFDGAYFLLSEHMERLAASVRYFGFKWNRSAIEKALAKTVDTLSATSPNHPPALPLKIRLRLRKDGSFRIDKEPVNPAPFLRVGFANSPIDPNGIFLYHKTTHRRVYQQALASRPDCDDVLLWNPRGEITESTIANVVLDIDGRRLTPPVTSGLLEGTYRRHLLAQGEISEQVLTKQDIARARSVYLINSVRQWINVRWMDDEVV